jgi:small subunit ribosomal protein S20
MANSLSAEKRIRQNETCRIRNKSQKSELKTLTKRLTQFITAKDTDQAQKTFRSVVAKLDQAGQKRLIHPNKVSREKSRLSRLLSTLS